MLKRDENGKTLSSFLSLLSLSLSLPPLSLLESTYGPPTLPHCSLPTGSLRHSSMAPTALTIDTASPFFVQ